MTDRRPDLRRLPEVEALGETLDRCAEALETIFRQRVRWWGGASL